MERERTVLLRWSELFVTAGVVHLLQEVALQSPFILNITKNHVAVLGNPSRGKLVGGQHVHIDGVLGLLIRRGWFRKVLVWLELVVSFQVDRIQVA